MQAVDTETAAGAHRWLILAGVWLLYFCFGLTAAAMGPLVTPIGAELQIGHGTMGAILGAWPLVYIFAAVPCGLALDRLGARPMLFLAALVMAGSGFARSLSETPLQLLLAVGIFGIGGPLISVGAPKVIAGLFEGKARATAMGVYVTGPYLGGLVALALTNSLAMPLLGDWRAVLQGLARGAMMTVAILILMEMPDMPRDRLGMAGGLFFTAAEIGGVLGPMTFGFLSALSGGFALPLGSATVAALVMALLLLRLRSSMMGTQA